MISVTLLTTGSGPWLPVTNMDPILWTECFKERTAWSGPEDEVVKVKRLYACRRQLQAYHTKFIVFFLLLCWQFPSAVRITCAIHALLANILTVLGLAPAPNALPFLHQAIMLRSSRILPYSLGHFLEMMWMCWLWMKCVSISIFLKELFNTPCLMILSALIDCRSASASLELHGHFL